MPLKCGVVAMAHHEPLRQRIADLADPDLQRAAVADQTGGVQPDRIFGVADRLGRRREQREIGVGTVEHRGEFIRRADRRRPGMNGSSELTCAEQLERRACPARGAQARRASYRCCSSGCSAVTPSTTRLATSCATTFMPARQQIRRRVGVVRGDVMLLRERLMRATAPRGRRTRSRLDVGRQRCRCSASA